MADLLAQICDLADSLTDPYQHSEPRWTWDANRNRKALPPHRTVVPGLIQQLRELAAELSALQDGGTHTVPESSPPGAFNAVDLLASITFGASYRVGGLGLTIRDTPEANIRAIVGAAGTLDNDTRHTIRAEFAAWHRQAEVITGWRSAAIPLPAPCPQCGANGKLLARADGDLAEAWCTGDECGARWDNSTIGILERHVTAYRNAADVRSRQARTEAVARRRAGELERHAVG